MGGKFKREVQEGSSRGREYVYLMLIHVVVWQKPTQHGKAVILQLKIFKKGKKKREETQIFPYPTHHIQ